MAQGKEGTTVGRGIVDVDEGDRTISIWANEIRRRAITAMGEREFAKLMLHFDQQVPPGDDQDRLLFVLGFLVKVQDPKSAQLAICWLDGAGYGETTCNRLFDEINRLRQERELRL